jgi:hypothetical protein
VRESLDRPPWLINTILKQQLYQTVLPRPIEPIRLIGHNRTKSETTERSLGENSPVDLGRVDQQYRDMKGEISIRHRDWRFPLGHSLSDERHRTSAVWFRMGSAGSGRAVHKSRRSLCAITVPESDVFKALRLALSEKQIPQVVENIKKRK